MTKLQVKERPKLSCDVWTSNSQIICESAQTRLHIKSPPCLFIKKSVLSLARSNFLTGAIINTRFQASLLAPPGPVIYFKIIFDFFHVGRVIFLSHFATSKGWKEFAVLLLRADEFEKQCLLFFRFSDWPVPLIS